MISNIKDCTLLNNGVRMPWLGFGVFKISDGQEVEQAVSYALEGGCQGFINHQDAPLLL
jgi:diketogulonate reductase-like aldo/keto reductase